MKNSEMFVIEEIVSMTFTDKQGNPLLDSRDKTPKEEKFDKNKNPIDILKTTTVPYELWNDDLFLKYGYGVGGICDEWVWTADLPNAEEEHIWKMIALCESYWRRKYEYWYRKEVKEFRAYQREKGERI